MKSNKIIGTILCLIFCMGTISIQSQTVDCKDRLMTEIDFTYNGGGTAPARWDINQVEAPGLTLDVSTAGYQYVATGNFSNVNTDYQNANNNLNTKREYAIVENPQTLSPQYANIPTDGMLVINPKQGENDQYVMFVAGGLVGGKDYYIELKVWNVIDLPPTSPVTGNCHSWCNWNNQLYIDWKGNQSGAEYGNQADKNWNGTNGNGGWSQGTNQVNNILKVSSGGSYAIISGKVTLPANASSMTLTLSKGNSSNPVVLGIDYIKMYGCQAEAIITSTGASDGSKVCETSALTLTAQGLGPAGSTYTWTETINGVTTPITGNSKSVTVTTPAGKDTKVVYTAKGTWATKTITLTTALCCYDVGDVVEVLRYAFPLIPAPGCANSANRGWLDGSDGVRIDPSYVFACGPGGIPDEQGGAQWKSGGYAVIKDTRADGHFGGWTSNPLDEHTKGYTGQTGTGMLAVNASATPGIFFEYDLPASAVCDDGSSYQFSAWYASADPRGADPCNIEFQLVEITGGVETVVEKTSTNPYGYIGDWDNGNVERWKQTTLVFTTQPNRNYMLRLINNGTGVAGNDVLIDDILITKCSPKIDFYPEGYAPGTESTETCSTDPIKFELKVPVNAATPNGDLSDLFPGNPTLYYQLQVCDDYNPALGTGSWQLLGPVETAAVFNITAEANDKWYRVKITTDPATAANTDPPSIACGTLEFYTRMFRIKLADALDVSVNSATASACVGGALEMTGVTGPTIGTTAQWGWKKGTDPKNDPFITGYELSSDENKKTFGLTSYATTDAGDYYFYVEEGACKNWAKVTVTTKSSPAVNAIPEQTICSGSSFTAVTLASTPAGATSYDWTVTQTGVTGATSGTGTSIPSTALTLSAGQTTPGTAVYSIMATLDGCQGAATQFTVNVVSLTATKGGTWQTTANYGDVISLTVSTTGTLLPSGGSFEYKWERKLSASGTYTTLTGQTTATLSDTPPAAGTYDYQVTVTMKEAGGTAVCTAVVLTHQVEVSNLKMCPKEEVYFCPGETKSVTGCGTAANGDPLDSWVWYKKGTTPGTPSTDPLDKTMTLTLAATDSASVWYFKGYKGSDNGDQEFVFLKRADYSFTVANTPVVACLNDAVTLTATASGSSVGAANIQYDWGSGYATSVNYTLSTAAAGTGSLTVTGKADDFCESAPLTINYSIAELVAARDNANPNAWKTKVYENEAVDLDVTATGSTIPTGGKIVYKWERSTNPSGTWTTITGAITGSLADTPAATGNCYRATVSIVDASNNTVCTPWVDAVHCVEVITATVGKDSTLYFCPGYDLELKGSAENVDYYVWYKQGDPEPQLGDPGLTPVIDPITGVSPGNISFTYSLTNVSDINNGEIWYFKVFSGPNNTKKQTFKITLNDPFKFTVDNAIFECKTAGGSKTIIANNTEGIANAKYEWTADNGQSQTYSSSSSFSLSTNDAISGNIIVKGKAENRGFVTNRCESSKTIPYLISQLELNPDAVNPWESFICEGKNTTFAVDTAGTGNLNGAQLEVIWEQKAASSSQWSTLSGTTPLSRTVSPVEKTAYRITARTKQGTTILCTKTLTHTLDVTSVKVGNDLSYGTCIDQPVTLQGSTSNGTSWQWEDEDGNVLVGPSTSISDMELTITPSETTNYYFVAFDNGCESARKQKHTVKVFDTKLQIKGGDRTSCPGIQIILAADTTGTNDVSNFYITWTKQPVSGLGIPVVISGSLTTYDSPTESMIYTAIVHNGGCDVVVSVTITISDPPTIVDVIEISPKTVQIEAIGGTPGTSYQYEYTIDNELPYVFDKVFEKVRIGEHVAYVRDRNNCIAAFPFFVNDVPFDFPKFFTPNGDGLHDTWKINNLDAFSNIDLKVYDRFGRQLIHITNPEKSWDGRYDGKLLRSDDYWYVLYIEETRKTYTGHFTLINPK